MTTHSGAASADESERGSPLACGAASSCQHCRGRGTKSCPSCDKGLRGGGASHECAKPETITSSLPKDARTLNTQSTRNISARRTHNPTQSAPARAKRGGKTRVRSRQNSDDIVARQGCAGAPAASRDLRSPRRGERVCIKLVDASAIPGPGHSLLASQASPWASPFFVRFPPRGGRAFRATACSRARRGRRPRRQSMCRASGETAPAA